MSVSSSSKPAICHGSAPPPLEGEFAEPVGGWAAGGVPVGVPGGGAPGKLPDIDTNVVLGAVVVTSASDALRVKDAPACGLNWTATVQLPVLG